MSAHVQPLEFVIEPAALIYASKARKVVRFDPPRLLAACPMPCCEWYVTGPDSDAGAALMVLGRRHHATSCHPEALEAGGLVLVGDVPYDLESVRVLASDMAEHYSMTTDEAAAAMATTAKPWGHVALSVDVPPGTVRIEGTPAVVGGDGQVARLFHGPDGPGAEWADQ